MDKNNYFKFELTLLFKAKKLRQTMIFCAYQILLSYIIIRGVIIHSDVCRIIYFPLINCCTRRRMHSIHFTYSRSIHQSAGK